MTEIERLGKEEAWGRDLFILELNHIDEVSHSLRPPSGYFACLLAWDATYSSADKIRSVGQKLIDQGAAYLCLWGADCERVHDLIDEVEALREEANPDDQSVIMTSWHHDESLSDAIWFVLHCTLPDDLYIDDCRSTLAISIGSSEWAAQIRAALSDPKKFSDEYLANDHH